MKLVPIIFLMGPTAAGKTPLAVQIVERFPCEIVSVDSAMVYKGMDIGTAKPGPGILQIAPHRLIDMLDPAEIYSAGKFRVDALREIEDIVAHGKIPLLVGGTMMYFRVLQQGIAALPRADASLRAELQLQSEQDGWEALHAKLAAIDPDAAKRIHARDGQRIQRALEVFMLTGRTMTDWQAEDKSPLSGYRVHSLAIAPTERACLHERIVLRFQQMLELGFVDEVRGLYQRGDLNPTMPSIRSVGYRQVWEHLSGESSFDDMCAKGVAATRQLAKRQLTWLRSWPDLEWFDTNDKNLFAQVSAWLENRVLTRFIE